VTTSATAAGRAAASAEPATTGIAGTAQPPRWPAPARTDPLAGTDVVVVDVETTGCQPGQDAITEIGAVRLHGGVVAAKFCSLANPGQPIPADITELTGITDGMVRAAPPVAAVLAGFLAFAQGSVLAAHNAPFDLAFLAAAARTGGLRWPAFAVIDTAVLARLVLGAPEVPDRKLSTLAGHFRTRVAPCHRALPDASATAEVLLGLLGLRLPAA
jgi:DNA polymerase III subunit epsilon